MTESNPVEVSSETKPQSGEVVARAARYYRMTRYFMVVMLFGYGIYSIYDGFYRYPKENEEARKAGKDMLPHPGLDVPFNQTFGVILPPLAIFMLFYCLHKSRGEIRFDGNTLSAPGHPPVPLENIAAMDQRLWDRKGIAYVEYDLGERKGKITLDDFIYEREPIDKIHDAIVKYMAPEDVQSGAAASPVVDPDPSESTPKNPGASD
jgi:hypothetical protein